MQKITTFLTFDDQAEEAAKLYVATFRDSKILRTVRSDGDGPDAKGAVFYVAFRLAGHEYAALNGGPTFRFSEGISLYVNCKTQKEVDTLWEKLSKGGKKGRCGWLKDRFGVSWQIIPEALGEMLSDSESGNSAQAMQAMLKMGKLDIAELRRAYAQRE